MSAPRLPGIGEANSQRTESAVRQLAQIASQKADTTYVDDEIAAEAQARSDADAQEVTDRNDAIDAAIAQEVIDRDNAIAAASYTPPSVADQRIMANISGGSAAPSANELSAILDDIIGTTQGAIVYRGASAWAKLNPGTNGQFLQTQGAAANPQWATVQQPTASAIKVANTARNTNQTLTDDPDLTLSVAASMTYLVEALLFYTAGGGNIHLALTGPTGATGLIIPEQGIGTSVSAAVGLASTTGAIGSNSTTGTQAVAIRGYIAISTTAGSATIQWNRSGASGTTTVLAGSWLRLTRVA